MRAVAAGVRNVENDISNAKVVLLITGIAAIGVGVLFLDWASYDVTIVGPFGDELGGTGGTGLDFDEGKISIIAGAASGLLGLLGYRMKASRQVIGLGMVAGAVVVTAAAVYFMANISDVTIKVPGLEANAKASIAAGGPVTIAGAVVLAIVGASFALERPSPDQASS